MDKNLKKLNRRELLEIMLSMQSEIEELKKENERLSQLAENRKTDIESAGSIAEAALKISKVFEAAQEAADIYLDNIKNRSHQSGDKE